DAFTRYVKDMWDQRRAWRTADHARDDSVVHRRATALGGWIGERLAQSPEQRDSMNEHVERAPSEMAPEFAEFLTR
ncbi:DUF445 family protein, partial [Burkholderia pseudomallei]